MPESLPVESGVQNDDQTQRVAADPVHVHHLPVLLLEVLEGLQIKPGARVIDATIGGGGHTQAILAQSAPHGEVLGIDADPAAIHRVRQKLALEVAQNRLHLVQSSFERLEAIAQAAAFANVDAILLDLGVSSFQLETPERGFAFRQSGPLDMRFDPGDSPSAAEIVNSWGERELADLIYKYGEERQSRRIARVLVQQRPFTTTTELAAAIEKALGGRQGNRLHPATRTFQALRIVVNRELAQLESVLPQALRLLKPGGRLAVIAFHSLEDRIVKQWIQQAARDFVDDPGSFVGRRTLTPLLKILTKKPIEATASEQSRNPRSRSAKLRLAEKV